MEIIRKYTKFDLCNIMYPLEITCNGLNGTSRPIYKDRRMWMEIFNTVCPTNILLTKVKKLRNRCPFCHYRVCTKTGNYNDRLNDRFRPRGLHQMLPLHDFIRCLISCLKTWNQVTAGLLLLLPDFTRCMTALRPGTSGMVARGRWHLCA